MKDLYRRVASAALSAVLAAALLPVGAQAEETGPLQPDSREDLICICEGPCEQGNMNADCPVCGAEGAAPEACARFSVQPEEPAAVEEDGPALLGVLDSAAYIDENGAAQTQSGVTEVTEEDTVWTSGWYIAQGNLTIRSRVTVDGAVVLILADGCNLTVDGGINVSAGNSFTVYGQENGSGFLRAVGATYDSSSGDAGIGGNADAVDFGDITLAATGTITATGGYRAAGIGGGGKMDNQVRTTGTITICSGTVQGEGGTFAAGIGSGADGSGNGSTIRITGGTVTGNGSAAIGAGYNGYAGDIEISGGTVFAKGNGRIGADEQWRGGMDGQFSTGENGNAVIFAESIQDQDQKADWSGMIFQGKDGQVYGTSVAPTEDFTIPGGYTLTIPWNATLRIEDGITAANNGIIENCGTISGAIGGTVNTRLALEILDENGADLAGKIRYGQTIFLKAFGPNLPESASQVSFTCNETSLGDAQILNGAAVLEIALPETADGSWPAGKYVFAAEAEDITGQQAAELRYLIVPQQPQATEVTATSITLQEVSYPELSPVPAVQYGYVRAGKTAQDITWKESAVFTGLDAGTDYQVFVRIVGDSTYHEMCSEGVRISTEPGLNAFPAGGLDLANGSLNIQSGTHDNLIVTQGTDLYDVDEDAVIPVTGDGTANHAQIILQSGSAAHVLLTDAQMLSADYDAPIQIGEDSLLSLTLNGENRMIFSGAYAEAGISMMSGSSVEIDGSGALTIGTPDAAPRVGIGSEMYSFRQITLLGGKVTVYGRYAGAGIWDTWHSGEEKPAVMICGGTLYAEITNDDSRGAAVGGRPMFDETDAVCEVQITGGTVVAGNGGICGDVTVTGGSVSGTIEGLTDARVSAGITAPAGTAVQALILRDADGVVAYGCPAVVPDSGELTLYLPAGTYSGAMLLDGCLKTFADLTASADVQGQVSLADTGIQVDLPDGTELPLETEEADVVLPAGSAIQTGSGPVIALPAGGTVTENGTASGSAVQVGDSTITAPEGGAVTAASDGTAELPAGSTVQTGSGPALTVSDSGAVAAPTGSVTLPGGGSVTMTDGQGNITTITVPAEGGSIVPDGNGGVAIPSGSTVQTGNGPAIIVNGAGASVRPAGELTLPGGSSVSVSDGQGSGITVTMPAVGGSIVPGESGSVTLPAGSLVQTGSGQPVTIPADGGVLQPDGDIRYTVKVTFDSQGGSVVDAREIQVGSLLTQPDKPVRDGYTFTGWYQDAACTAAWNFADMPVTADLTLYAGWKKISSGGSSGGSSSGNSAAETGPSGGQETQSNPFADVAGDAYYHDAVLWAVENGITAGLTETEFGPDQACTRAQMVTFLYRAAGSPKVTGTASRFADVSPDAYYYDAVLWAAEQGITGGTTDTTFSPNATVTRAQTVTFLYRAAGSPAGSGSGFADVAADAYYADAVAWAAEEGITSGTTAETFSPARACTRAQIVTFLYRDRA